MAVYALGALVPQIDPEAFVHPDATVIGDVHLGPDTTVWPHAVLRGDYGRITVGARTSIQDGCVAHATDGKSTTSVGIECTVGHRVVLHGCKVSDHCLVGMGSVLLDNAELGEWCFLGAGSLVTPERVFPPRSFILGSPAKRVREVTAHEMEWITYSWKAYQDLTKRYRAQAR